MVDIHGGDPLAPGEELLDERLLQQVVHPHVRLFMFMFWGDVCDICVGHVLGFVGGGCDGWVDDFIFWEDGMYVFIDQ